MKNIYLILAIIGAIGPYLFFIEHFAEQGWLVTDFLSSSFATPAASGFAVDLIISSAVFWVVILLRQRVAGGPRAWPFIIVNLTIGLSCAIPAYLYITSKADEALPTTVQESA